VSLVSFLLWIVPLESFGNGNDNSIIFDHFAPIENLEVIRNPRNKLKIIAAQNLMTEINCSTERLSFQLMREIYQIICSHISLMFFLSHCDILVFWLSGI
jgi:hypothetical protein